MRQRPSRFTPQRIAGFSPRRRAPSLPAARRIDYALINRFPRSLHRRAFPPSVPARFCRPRRASPPAFPADLRPLSPTERPRSFFRTRRASTPIFAAPTERPRPLFVHFSISLPATSWKLINTLSNRTARPLFSPFHSFHFPRRSPKHHTPAPLTLHASANRRIFTPAQHKPCPPQPPLKKRNPVCPALLCSASRRFDLISIVYIVCQNGAYSAQTVPNDSG